MKHPLAPPATTLSERCGELGIVVETPEAAHLVALLDRCFVEPQNLTSIRELDAGIDRHLVDSLYGLRLPVIVRARRLADIGSGVGFPGIALAVARPDLRVTLIESERSKADWLARATVDIPNVQVVHDRAEALARFRRADWDVVTVRAVGGLATVLELAAPLLADGGSVVAWRGRRDGDGERAGQLAAATLGLTPGAVTRYRLHDGSVHHLHEFQRTGIVPARFPRRPGLANKRPIGAPTPARPTDLKATKTSP